MTGGSARSEREHPSDVLVSIEAVASRHSTALVVRGEIDIATGPVLARHLDEALTLHRWVTVDLRPTEFIDCSGLAVLVRARRQARARGGDLDVVASPRHLRLIRLTAVDLPVVIDAGDPVVIDAGDRPPAGNTRRCGVSPDPPN